MRNRIKHLRKAKGWTQSDLAEAVGVHFTTINKYETGVTELNAAKMEVIAEALGVQVGEIFAESPPPEPIHVRGRVQAGAWAESLEWDDGDRYPVWVPIPDQWRPFAKFGVEVHGPSMNRRYPEGTVLICVPIIEADIEPKEGQRYIVERTDTSGFHEMTVKELRFDRDGRPWLWPDSDDPKFQEPLAADGENGDEVQIRAIVITSVQPE